MEALIFLLETVGELFISVLLLRFYMQLNRVPHHNPVAPFVFALTDFLVRPARKVIPGLWGIDLSTLTLAWIAEIILVLLSQYLLTSIFPVHSAASFAALAFIAVTRLIRLSLNMLMYAIIIQALLSWVNPYSPLSGVLNRLTAPFLQLFQKRIPPVGNVDLSPLVAILAIQVILMLPLPMLEALFLRWL